VANGQDFAGLTWKEHSHLFLQALFSWQVFLIVLGINMLLAFTIGVVFQFVFLFSFLQGFIRLAMISQPIYSAFLFITHDKSLPRRLSKPPVSAYLVSIIFLLISIFFLFLGILAYQKTGFCSQSIGCIIVLAIRSIANGH
jgi:hypothetical protein